MYLFDIFFFYSVLKAPECSDDRNNKSPNNDKSENTQSTTSPLQQRSSCSPVPDIQSKLTRIVYKCINIIIIIIHRFLVTHKRVV